MFFPDSMSCSRAEVVSDDRSPHPRFDIMDSKPDVDSDTFSVSILMRYRESLGTMVTKRAIKEHTVSAKGTETKMKRLIPPILNVYVRIPTPR